MKVFRVQASGWYAMGMAIVAAKDVRAAAEVAATIPSGQWRIKWNDPESIEELPSLTHKGKAGVVTYFEMGD